MDKEREEARKKARRELGLPDQIVGRGARGWGKALGLLIVVLLAVLAVVFG